MSALSSTSRKFIALAIPALALGYFVGCSPQPPGTGGTGGAAVGTGGLGTGTGGAGTGTGGLGTGTGGAGTGTGGLGTGTGGLGTGTGGLGTGTGGLGTGTGGLGTGTGGGSTGPFVCTPPTLPEPSGLTTVNPFLPDPFKFYDGTPVTTHEQWDCRAKEIRAMAAKYLYAPVPPEPDDTTGTVSGGSVTMNVTVGAKTESFTATISGSGSGIVLNLGNGIAPGTAKTLSFGSGFLGKIEGLFGVSGMNINIANGWMIDRVMDVLEANPGSGHDHNKIMVTGCSGCGKAAYLAGVFSRVPLTVIVESGGGGAANLRQAEWFRHGDGQDGYQCIDQGATKYPQSIDNLEDTGACTPWVTEAARWLRNDSSKVYNLPFDTHLLLASIAPRHLLHFSNDHGVNQWCHLGGTCEALSSWAAKSVWKALGIPERMGFHQYSGGHCGAPGDARAVAGEFFARVFDGDTTADTDIMEIMEDGVQQPISEWKDMWIDWNMDTVLTP